MDTFGLELLNEIFKNVENTYSNNYDYMRFGLKPVVKTSWKSKCKKLIKKILNINEIKLEPWKYEQALCQLKPYFNGFEKLYMLLSDDRSKSLLIKIISYRILGESKVLLPLSTPSYWENIKTFDNLKDLKDFISVKFVFNDLIKLYKYNLNSIGIPLQLYYNSVGIQSLITIKQYEYISEKITIKPTINDVVLDCGACWGDTALFFANEVGDRGHVYSFEFIPSNIQTFNINIELNRNVKQRITLIPKPLAETSQKELYFIDNGPGSRVSEIVIENSGRVETICIDDFIHEYNVKKVDFIKMDIEGSELSALKGGINAIKKFKPRLAISIYHSLNDFVDIPNYISSLNLGYSFYLNHGTIHDEETVLIAVVI